MLGEIERTLSQKNYPCIAALRSFFRNEYVVGFYDGFGEGRDWRALRRDLSWFLREQRRSTSPYLTMWAIFPTADTMDEARFEEEMWSELSHLTSLERKESDWGNAAPSEADPSSKDFSFRLDGEAVFVVGLHPLASRIGRRFPWTAMIFNAFDQFERLEQAGVYDRMVTANRKRDQALQGSPNPMSVQHGDAWETIQFSGRENPPEWKCPFRFLAESEKSERVTRIPPQEGTAFVLRTGDLLTVTDPEGGQVADLFCVSRADPKDALSSGRSIDYNETVSFTAGHLLYAASGKVMLRIEEDSCGCHDFLVTPCSQQMFEMISGKPDHHPSCLENLSRQLGKMGVRRKRIGTTFNLFMNVPVASDGKIQVLLPDRRRETRFFSARRWT